MFQYPELERSCKTETVALMNDDLGLVRGTLPVSQRFQYRFQMTTVFSIQILDLSKRR